MNTQLLTLGTPDRTLRRIDLPPAEIVDRAATGPFVGLVLRLAQLHAQQSSGYVLSFTSVSRGEGVTYVVESLAWELARHTGQSVLVATPAAIARMPPAYVPHFPVDGHRVWRLGLPPAPAQPGEPEGTETLRRLRERFGYILLDCPPLNESSATLRAAAISHGLALVVASGEASRRDVETARAVLSATQAPVIGVVLNKHQNPVPGFFSSLL